MPSFRRSKFGPTPKISHELIEKICNAMRAGIYLETACIINDVSKDTLKAWGKRGHRFPNSIYAVFLSSVQKALAEAESRDVLNIDKCAMGTKTTFLRNPDGSLVLNGDGDPVVEQAGLKPDWSASAWRLERRSARWTKAPAKIELTGKDGEAFSHAPAPQLVIMLPENMRDKK